LGRVISGTYTEALVLVMRGLVAGVAAIGLIAWVRYQALFGFDLNGLPAAGIAIVFGFAVARWWAVLFAAVAGLAYLPDSTDAAIFGLVLVGPSLALLIGIGVLISKVLPRRIPLAAALACTTVVVLVALWVINDPTRVFDVQNAAFGSSLSKEVGGYGGECEGDAVDVERMCRVETDPGSGAFDLYRVRVDHHGCWIAEEIGSSDRQSSVGAYEPPSGCAEILDYLVPDEPEEI
jgi:hypothetical protein